jgi:hypothetical protein
VLLEPMKGNPRQGMNRKIRIATALALVGALSVSAPAVSLAGSPLLSGYGGPGAGEQAIVGSTLLNGPRGGSGPGGGQGRVNSTATGVGASGAIQSTRKGESISRAHTPPAQRGSSSSGQGSHRGASHAGGSSAYKPSVGVNHGAYAYTGSPRSADSSVFAISTGDLLLLVATLTTLALVGALTMRLGRLQR